MVAAVRENRMPRDGIGIEKDLDAEIKALLLKFGAAFESTVKAAYAWETENWSRLNVAQGQSCPRDAVQHTHRPRGVLHRYRDAAAVRAVRERQLEGIDLPVIVPPPADLGVFPPTPLSYTAVESRIASPRNSSPELVDSVGIDIEDVLL